MNLSNSLLCIDCDCIYQVDKKNVINPTCPRCGSGISISVMHIIPALNVPWNMPMVRVVSNA